MPKKVIITESMAKKLVIESSIKDMVNSDEFTKKVKDVINKTAFKNNKEFEDAVKKVVAKSIENLFRVLWQRNSFFSNEIQK